MSDSELKKCDCCPNCNIPLEAQDTEKVPDTWFWIKDAKGYGSVTVTFATVAFWVTTLSFVISNFEQIGPFTVRPFDVAACSSYFTPILMLYFSRKYTEAKFNNELKDKDV